MKFIRVSPSILNENQSIKTHLQLDEIDSMEKDLDKSLNSELSIPDDVLNSFKLKTELNPSIWTQHTLDPKIQKKLLKISQDFIKDLDLPKGIIIKDIIFTGSLANYNWSKFSDIDLHIVTDFNQFDADPKLMEKLFHNQKTLWNQEHNITIHDYPVEVYMQDSNAKFDATAIYSILKNKWIRKPIKNKLLIDKQIIKNKTQDFIYLLKDIQQDYKDKNYQSVVDKTTKLKKKIKQMRKAGLENGGEFSQENLVFKTLRRMPFMDILDSFKAKAYDELMSITELSNLYENEILNNTNFETIQTEDGFEMLAMLNNDEIGALTLDIVTNGYWIFEDDLSIEEYEYLFPDDEFMQITHLSVPDNNMKNHGIAKKLMSMALAKSKELNFSRVYLNASPMGYDGLPLNKLISFYENFGFKVFKHQGNNALMILILNDLNEEIQKLPDTTFNQELKYHKSSNLSSNTADVNKIRHKMTVASQIAKNYSKETGDDKYFMLPIDGDGFYQVQFKHDGQIKTQHIKASADMLQQNGKFKPTDVGTCKTFQNIAKYCFVKAGKNNSAYTSSPAEDAAYKALIIFKNEILDFYNATTYDDGKGQQISMDKMSDKQALHKKKKDLETQLGRNISDSEWQNYLNNNVIPPKKNLSLDSNIANDVETRQKLIQAKLQAYKDRLNKH